MDHSIRQFAEDQISEAHKILAHLRALGVDDDQELVADTIEGEVNFEDIADELIKEVAEANILIEGIKKQQDALSARKGRMETRLAGLKALASRILEAAKKRKMERPGGTISLARTAQQLGEVDEAKVPAKYWVEKDPAIDRRRLLADLKAGVEIPGCMLTNGGESVRIKV